MRVLLVACCVASAAAFVPALGSATCFSDDYYFGNNQAFLLGGQNGIATAKECQALCAQVEGCAFFSSFRRGFCRLVKDGAERFPVPPPDEGLFVVTSGPVSCDGKEVNVLPRFIPEIVTDGTCRSHGYEPITNKAECLAAANIVGVTRADGVPVVWNNVVVPAKTEGQGFGAALTPTPAMATQSLDAPGCWPTPLGLVAAGLATEQTLCVNPFLDTAGNEAECSEEFRCVCKRGFGDGGPKPRLFPHIVESGDCNSHGLVDIIHPDECLYAANILLPDTEWTNVIVPPTVPDLQMEAPFPPQQPTDAPGCWPFPDQSGMMHGVLCANPFLQEAGNPVSCSDEFKCICKQPEFEN